MLEVYVTRCHALQELPMSIHTLTTLRIIIQGPVSRIFAGFSWLTHIID